MKKRLAYCLLLVCMSTILCAQQSVYKNWREYFSFYATKQIEQYENIAIVLSDNGVFFYNTESEKITRLTKLQGLSAVDLTCMTYDTPSKRLFIGYANGTIDVVSLPSLNITSIVDIYQKPIYNSKAINQIQISNNIAYIATDFGIVTFNVEKMQFLHTTIFGALGEYVAVNESCVQAQTLYAATNTGIFSIDISKNLSDNTLWTRESTFAHGNDKTQHILTFAGNIYYVPEINNLRDTVFVYNGSSTSEFRTLSHINRLRTVGNDFAVISPQTIELYNTQLELSKTISADDFAEIPLINKNSNDLLYINNNLFITGNTPGLTNVSNKKTITPEGPYSNHVADVAFNNNKLYVAGGRYDLWNYGMINVLRENSWSGHWNWSVRNSTKLYVPNGTNIYYYATLGFGLVQSSSPYGFDTIFNRSNSILLPPLYNNIESEFVSVNTLTSDRKNNIWMINYYTKEPLVVKTTDGRWFSYSLQIDYNSRDIVVDRNNTKWIAGNNKLVAFNENGSFENTADDRLVLLNLEDNEGIIAGWSRCLALDINGVLWIGTDQGLAYHAHPTQVLNGNTTLVRPKITIDGEIGYVLSSESINCIFVDGGNRKWVGTENSGVFLISTAEPVTQIHHFNVDNSPLPTNNVHAITINQTTGEVFFASDKGLVSFMSDATLGVAEQEEILIFPNPVREHYTGDIRIQKLTANAHVHITDMDGNMVFATIANGGTAVWNGQNTRGERVATGVYFVYASNDDGSQTRVSKLLFIH
ncbi:MAG: T9SS type A sorting domain-containing protein [Bacteroidales bacterium]|jgi:hypothetical protein|nr:T9SS type A sorting domain-containing protein [Bacteroidales bacterium]